MQIKTLVRDNQSLIPAVIELSFLPGLPQIHFLGLPDQLIKESLFRIKSALRSCGFEFPKTHQIVVNIRPTHIKKSSRGLELAVALGILQATKQIELPESFTDWYFYGELTLQGDVLAPDDLYLAGDWKRQSVTVLTGPLNQAAFFRSVTLKSLAHSQEIDFSSAEKEQGPQTCRPHFGKDLFFTQEQARFLEIAVWGGHSALLAGPAGVGKSTLAKALWSLMPPLRAAELEDMNFAMLPAPQAGGKTPGVWRPFLQPHHTSTPLSMVGGGVPPRQGEVSRAHRGLLVLDEFLEFKPAVQEALREPMEEARIRLSRSYEAREFPARAQYIGTTNLCPCGDWVPDRQVRCSRSAQSCRGYREKLSGPILDRFQILFFCRASDNRSSSAVLGSELLSKLEGLPLYAEAGLVNAYLSEPELLKRMSSLTILEHFPWEEGSYRRKIATMRVALTIAQLDGRESMGIEDLQEAMKWTWLPHQALKNQDGLTWERIQHSLGPRFHR